MQLDIEWQEGISADQWRSWTDRVHRGNLIQSFPYVAAVRFCKYQSTRLGVIKIDGVAKGICQIQEVSLLKFIHRVFLDRGPVWFDKDVPDEWVQAFFEAFQKEFPPRFGRKRRVMPEWSNTKEHDQWMQDQGYQKAGKGYQSIWLDLTGSQDDLRMRLDKKWRSTLKKAEKQKLNIIPDPTGESLEWFLKNYMKDRLEKSYANASPKFLRYMYKYSYPGREAFILTAYVGKEATASILIFVHGTSATYQVGWSRQKGRDMNATYLLLWQAMIVMQGRGVTDFDLGGIDEEHAAGLTSFKKRMGGAPYELVGVYR